MSARRPTTPAKSRAGTVPAKSDEGWMREAVAEAELGLGLTTPNPAVGCILVRDGREVARGHYRGAGGLHAEAVALASAGSRARGATAYVTLEPHAHQGRTPPCTDALIRAGIRRAVIGCKDPNDVVCGRGIRQLRAAGIETEVGVLAGDCENVIRGYRRFITGQGPFVHLKLASSLDGRIAAAGGDSRWISTDRSRALVQQMRRRAEAILVGVGTVLADDPRLTCRIAGASSPLRVVLDPELRTPPDAKVVRGRGRSLVIGNPATPGSPAGAAGSGTSRSPKTPAAQARRHARLARSGALVECFDTRGVRGWKRLLGRLAELGVMELLIEGGGQVAASAIRAGVVNRVSIFYNPRFLGADGVAMVGPLGVRRASDGPTLRTLDVRPIGEDLLWEGEFQ